MKIRDMIITPIAFSDPPLLNSWGVHEPLALRCVVEIVLQDGTVGLGECQGGSLRTDQLRAVREAVIGQDVFATSAIEERIHAVLGDQTVAGGGAVGMPRMAVRGVFAPIEVACLDAQGKLLGVRVCDLLGGPVRDAVPYSAYLFYKWAEHPALDGREPIGDTWGAALDPGGLVAQTRALIDRYGFTSIKLKAGVFPPEQEIAAIKALAAAFPGLPLRIDPNGGWSVPTAIRVGRELETELEYLEDPVLGREQMAAVAREVSMPLATNMCVVAFEDIPDAVARGSVGVVLSDHHVWGGLRHSLELAAICRTFDLGVSMHSNSHLGISLAAMTHLGAATPNLSYACDTHYPWNLTEEIVRPGALRFVDGSVPVPDGPGLGVELDRDALARQHEVLLRSGRTVRDDTSYMRRVEPGYDPTLPRF
ncbi:glucarate dehydratase family protein [Microlunatus panaciterrae]|uniref:glucarate dehydratase n=1 Tax=Microlunatus panaciterrae TaxID=400768 RepID=A0ABS2RF41_9ACTN|nr:enolase C-terminal domain-like protein [Microlunatus panaciterrae]MBM7797621.1 glucarate dehydratase [Microlunatus panaciterrae]